MSDDNASQPSVTKRNVDVTLTYDGSETLTFRFDDGDRVDEYHAIATRESAVDLIERWQKDGTNQSLTDW